MGIKPSGDNPIIVPPDNIQSRWGEWEADLDAAGQVAGEVNLETWSLADSATTWISQNAHKLEGLLEDSAGIGDDQKTINEEMRELLDPENPDSVLWEMYFDVEELQRQRDATQDEAIETLEALMYERTRDVWRTIFVDRWENHDGDFIIIDADPNNDHRRRVEAKGTWVGQYVWQSVLAVSGAASIEGVKVGGTTSRINTHPAYNQHASILMYTVDAGTAKNHDDSRGSFTPDRDEWVQAFTFTAPDTADYLVFFRTGWAATTYRDTYGIQITRNGSEIASTGKRVRVGPQFPWGNGYRTQTLTDDSFRLTAGDVLSFEMWAGSTEPAERRSRESSVKLAWIAPPDTSTGTFALETTAGAVGFVHTDMYPEINWDPNGSIKFGEFPVTADKNVRSENDAFDIVDVAAGTVIPDNRRIYSVVDSAETVTFTRAD